MAVDVASGNLYRQYEDYSLDGRHALVLTRRYSTSLLDKHFPGMLGYGWTTSFETLLSMEKQGLRFLSESGDSEIVFPVDTSKVKNIEKILNEGAFAELTYTEKEFCVCRWNPLNGEIVKDYFSRKHAQNPIPPIRRENGNGDVLDFEYSKSTGLLKYVIQRREKRVFQFVYDEHHRLHEVLFKVGRIDKLKSSESSIKIASYQYDQNGYLAKVIDVDGHSATYRYDSYGQLLEEKTISGKKWQFSYDDVGRCIVTTSAGKFDYNALDYSGADKGFTTVTDGNDQVTRYHYNRLGQVVKTITPLGRVLQTVFDPAGRTVQEISPSGSAVQYEYDEWGNLCKTSLPDGSSIEVKFNEHHQVTELVNASGHSWTWDYIDGRIKTVTNPLGETQQYSYDSKGDLEKISLAGQVDVKYGWNQRGELTSETDFEGNVARYEWDVMGNVSAFEDPNGARTSVEYDSRGRAIKVELPGSLIRHYEWGVFDNMLGYTDENGEKTCYQYCDCGNLERVERSDGTAIHYGYTTIPGQIEAITNQKGEVWHFEYDADGRVIREKDFSGRVLSHTIDDDDRISQTVYSDGEIECTVYDSLGRILVSEYPNSERSVKFSYDQAGLLTGADNGDCALTFTHDALGRVIEESQGDHTLWHEFDVLGNRLTRRTSLDTEARYEWTRNGCLKSISIDNFDSIVMEYDARGRESSITHAAVKLNTKYGIHDAMVSQIVESAKPGLVRSFSHNSRGDIVEHNDSVLGKLQVRYDSVGRVVQTTLRDRLTENFSYDKADNLLAVLESSSGKKVELGITDEWAYQAGNEIIGKPGVGYKYDNRGRLIERTESGKSGYFRWDCFGRLAEFENSDGEVWSYSYDPLGRRINKSNGSVTTNYLWDGDFVLHEWLDHDEQNLVTSEYRAVDHSLLCRVENERMFVAVRDQVGRTEHLLDGNGELAWSCRSRLFGEPYYKPNEDLGFTGGFPGQFRDEESGLFYNRFRYYSGETGAYISNDLLGLGGGINPRAYVLNPYSWSDPYGLMGICSRIMASAKRHSVALRLFLMFSGQDPATPEIDVHQSNSQVTQAQSIARTRQQNGETPAGASPPPPPPPDPPDPPAQTGGSSLLSAARNSPPIHTGGQSSSRRGQSSMPPARGNTGRTNVNQRRRMRRGGHG